MTHDLESRTTWAVIKRIGGFILLVTFLNTLDRANVSFAALTMNDELGFDPRIFGWGVGLFFVTYILCAIPVTSVAQRWGAERALPLMMVAFGVIAALMGAMQSATSFFVLRLLLGLAETGVSPMLLLMQSQWIPQQALGRLMMVSSFALPLSFILGAPLSGWLMTHFHDVGSISGWRWMFLAEGMATVVIGIAAWFWLPRGPQQARWLDESQRQWLIDTLHADSRKEQRDTSAAGGWDNFLATLRLGRVWTYAACYFCSSLGFYVLLFWLPQIVRDLFSHLDTLGITSISVVPWIGVMAGIVGISWHSDLRRERHLHIAGAALLGATGMIGAALLMHAPVLALASMTLAGAGIGAAQLLLWTLPIGELRGKPHAAIAFAFVNLVGNLAGLAGAPLIGILRKASDSFVSSVFAIAAVLVVEACVLLALRRHVRAIGRATHGIASEAPLSP